MLDDRLNNCNTVKGVIENIQDYINLYDSVCNEMISPNFVSDWCFKRDIKITSEQIDFISDYF